MNKNNLNQNRIVNNFKGMLTINVYSAVGGRNLGTAPHVIQLSSIKGIFKPNMMIFYSQNTLAEYQNKKDQKEVFAEAQKQLKNMKKSHTEAEQVRN